MSLEQQFKIILKAAKIRSVLDKVKQGKYKAVQIQNFDEAAKLRDKERLLQEKLDEMSERMSEIYDEYFPEESKEMDEFLI